MEDTNEILNQALSVRYNDLMIACDPKKIDLIAKAYKFLFQSDLCTTCPGDILNGYYRINSHLKNPLVMPNEKTPCNYKLKEGVVLTDHSTHKLYSNANLTDEAAESILKATPGAAKWFDLIAGEAPGEVPQAEGDSGDMSLEEALKFIDAETTSFADLKSVCEENGFDKKQWGKMKSKSELKEYIKANLTDK